jgi:hypothetical protein
MNLCRDAGPGTGDLPGFSGQGSAKRAPKEARADMVAHACDLNYSGGGGRKSWV